MCSRSACEDKGKVFQIKGTTEFADRSNSIFSGLNELEEKHDKWKAETPVMLNLQKPDPSASEILDCKAGTFKRPRFPLSLKRKRHADAVPDYVMNPHKWKKYSLADTPGVTEESNTAVALQFFKDLRKKREEEPAASGIPESMIFRKPTPTIDSNQPMEQESETPYQDNFTCSSVHKMPELVVGEKRQKVAKSVPPTGKVGTVKLDHLEENFDDLL